jgi:hypothetical protein
VKKSEGEQTCFQLIINNELIKEFVLSVYKILTDLVLSDEKYQIIYSKLVGLDLIRILDS